MNAKISTFHKISLMGKFLGPDAPKTLLLISGWPEDGDQCCCLWVSRWWPDTGIPGQWVYLAAVAPVRARRPRWQEPLQERNCRRPAWAGADQEERGRCASDQQDMGKVRVEVLLVGSLLLCLCLAIGKWCAQGKETSSGGQLVFCKAGKK